MRTGFDFRAKVLSLVAGGPKPHREHSNGAPSDDDDEPELQKAAERTDLHIKCVVYMKCIRWPLWDTYGVYVLDSRREKLPRIRVKVFDNDDDDNVERFTPSSISALSVV